MWTTDVSAERDGGVGADDWGSSSGNVSISVTEQESLCMSTLTPSSRVFHFDSAKTVPLQGLHLSCLSPPLGQKTDCCLARYVWWRKEVHKHTSALSGRHMPKSGSLNFLALRGIIFPVTVSRYSQHMCLCEQIERYQSCVRINRYSGDLMTECCFSLSCAKWPEKLCSTETGNYLLCECAVLFWTHDFYFFFPPLPPMRCEGIFGSILNMHRCESVMEWVQSNGLTGAVWQGS